MNTVQIKLKIPTEIFSVLNESEKEIERDAKISIAVWFYLNEKISLAKSAQLAGMTKTEFETILSEKQIPISLMNEDDIQEELANMKNI